MVEEMVEEAEEVQEMVEEMVEEAEEVQEMVEEGQRRRRR
jgi:hypothetical protein